MIETLKKEIERIRLEKKDMLLKAIGVFVFVSLASIYLLNLTPDIAGVAGFAVYDTFEPEYQSVVGASQGSTISFEHIPSIIARPGDRIKFQVKANKQGVTFSDNSLLFDIGKEGLIDFVAEQPGEHRVFVIITKGDEFYYQDFIIRIEE